MTNVVYRNLTKDEAEQMAFELEVEDKFEFEVKEEGGAWSVHYWSKDERPAATAARAGAGPSAPAGGLPEAAAPAPVAPLAAGVAARMTPAATPLRNPPLGWVLGSLSRKYEVGDRGPEAVSTGAGDPGGVSYGSYQMTSRGGGTVLKFVSDAAFPWRDRFVGLTPGGEEFSARWRALAAEAPDAFFEAQHAFIESTHFAPLVERIRVASGLDVTDRSHALQDAVWSTAVQHGPNSSVMNRAIAAVGGVDALRPDALDGDRRLIRAIYAERGRRGADGRLVHFSRVYSDRVQQSVANRFASEERDALAMLDS